MEQQSNAPYHYENTPFGTYLELQQFINSSNTVWSACKLRSLFALLRMYPSALWSLPVPVRSADMRLDWIPPDRNDCIPVNVTSMLPLTSKVFSLSHTAPTWGKCGFRYFPQNLYSNRYLNFLQFRKIPGVRSRRCRHDAFLSVSSAACMRGLSSTWNVPLAELNLAIVRHLNCYPLRVRVRQISGLCKCLVWSGYWFVGVAPSSATPTNQSEGQSKPSYNPEIRRTLTLSG